MKTNYPRAFRPNHTWIVASVLLISLMLRWILIFRGGQYYISDETRYEVSRNAARFLLQNQFGEALRQFTISPEHLGFKVIGIIPALLERIVGTSLVFPAIFLASFLSSTFILSFYSPSILLLLLRKLFMLYSSPRPASPSCITPGTYFPMTWPCHSDFWLCISHSHGIRPRKPQ